MILQFLSVNSKSDLSELNYLLSKKIPTNHFIFIKKTSQNYIILFNKRYKKSFCQTTVGWINKKICRNTIEEVLKKISYIEPSEHVKIRQKLIEKTDCRFFNKEICQKMSEICRYNNILNLDGFIIFGLKEYNDKLKDLIILNLNEIITENTYENFINLLKEYICTENSLMKTMYIEAQTNGSCKFFNEEHKDISQECINIFKTEFGEIGENDDLLLSTLIIFLPNKIFLYRCNLIQNKNILYTLKNIFGDRIVFSESPAEIK